MSEFQIGRNLATAALRYADDTIRTSLTDDVARIVTSSEKGIINPLHILTFGELGGGVFRPALWSKSATRLVEGKPGSALYDAVESLHNLGRRHKVQGINLAQDPGHYGGIMHVGDIGYVSGSPITGPGGIGREAAFRIDRAARLVADFAKNAT